MTMMEDKISLLQLCTNSNSSGSEQRLSSSGNMFMVFMRHHQSACCWCVIDDKHFYGYAFCPFMKSLCQN
jgi:hypothetical protein